MLTESDKRRIYDEARRHYLNTCTPWPPSTQPADRAAADRAGQRAVEDAEEAQRVSEARLRGPHGGIGLGYKGPGLDF